MSTYALVASPLVGPAAWRWLAAELERRGHTVVVPSLAPPDAPAPVWAAQVDVLRAQLRDLEEAVLVGHSAAGRIVPLVAEQLDGARCLHVDAQLPVDLLAPPDGDWFLAHVRTLVDGDRLPPWSEWWGEGAWEGLVPDPARRDAITPTLPRVPPAVVEEVPPAPGCQVPGAYLRLSAVYDVEAAVAQELDRPVARIDGGHLHFAVDEQAVADACETLVDQLDG